METLLLFSSGYQILLGSYPAFKTHIATWFHHPMLRMPGGQWPPSPEELAGAPDAQVRVSLVIIGHLWPRGPKEELKIQSQ